MKSPITGKEMQLIKERRITKFRKDEFEVIFQYFKCIDSGEQFTTEEIDNLNINQVYNQYRVKHNIPFPEEIKNTREKYGLSKAKMSEILGFGVNTYTQYELGEIPNTSNARLIQTAADAEQFLKLVLLSDSLDEKNRQKIKTAVEKILTSERRAFKSRTLQDYVLGSKLPDIYSGFRSPNFEKFAGMVIHFAKTLEPFKTKMNKLVFYADYMMFRKHGQSISGMRYVAIDRGPVPDKFQTIYEYLAYINKIEIKNVSFQNYVGDKFKASNSSVNSQELFSETEIEILNEVCNIFKETSTKDIVDLSHKEKAWIENQVQKSTISYHYAFDLSQV